MVVSRAASERESWDYLDASTAEAAISALDAFTDASTVCAVLAPIDEDDAIAHEETIALVSLLVMRGVVAFETNDPKTVRRILDTHAAISSGQIEVLES